jgi:hypothetical protein
MSYKSFNKLAIIDEVKMQGIFALVALIYCFVLSSYV